MTASFRQKEQGFMTYPGGAWLKRAAKSPIILWRMGLGPLLGRIFILLTTTGRKSGLPRRTMIEYHMLNGRKYAPSAFGPRSDWYRNTMADPLVTIQTADGVERMTATRVTEDDELLTVYELFMRRDPVMTKPYLESLDIRPDPTDIVAKKDRIHWLRFDPTSAPTPPPLEADLKWVWLVALAFLLAMRFVARRRRS